MLKIKQVVRVLLGGGDYCERGSDIEQKIGILMSPIWAWLKLYFTSKRLGSNRSQIGFTEQYLQ